MKTKKDPNYLAAVEKAIAEKYGKKRIPKPTKRYES
jgi:hypothetical protein